MPSDGSKLKYVVDVRKGVTFSEKKQETKTNYNSRHLQVWWRQGRVELLYLLCWVSIGFPSSLNIPKSKTIIR